MAGRKANYVSAAERQKAYRERKRNAPSVTKCPKCGGSNVIAVDEGTARQFGIYCECLCFECNGLVTTDGRIWTFHGRAHQVLEWIAFKS
jgi:hypothetical protein